MQAVRAVAGVFVAIILLPPIIVVLPFYLVLLRMHEVHDKTVRQVVSTAGLAALEAREDWVTQNEFTAVGLRKPGPFRRFTLKFVLIILNFGCQHIFNRGNLAGVRTIHFARWVVIDDYRRVLFASNYDGSLESYMDDFIDKVAFGLNAVFSNGVGYPRPTGSCSTAPKTSRLSRICSAPVRSSHLSGTRPTPTSPPSTWRTTQPSRWAQP